MTATYTYICEKCGATVTVHYPLQSLDDGKYRYPRGHENGTPEQPCNGTLIRDWTPPAIIIK